MNFRLTLIAAIIAQILLEIACSKDQPSLKPVIPNTGRTIRFELFTKKDFSNDNGNIIFSLFIKSHSATLFDSTLSGLKIKDIPDSTHRLAFEKKVPDDDGSDLAAGFRYDMENVGHAGYTDTSKAGEKLKVIAYSFK
jgi:hypothetical protein